MKQLFYSFLSLVILGIAVGAGLIGWGVHQYTAPGPLTKEKLVMIERGSGISTIANQLQSEDIISNDLIFKIVARFGHTLKAGEYKFPNNISMADVVIMMEQGVVFDRKITIAEGLTVQQIVKRLNAREDLEGKITNIPKEGSILPNTYHFIKGETRQDIINKMQKAMVDLFPKYCPVPDLYPTNISSLYNYNCVLDSGQKLHPSLQTIGSILTLASIVEKETGVGGERAKVAGVFINRLRKGMPLQTDPTVIYAITKGDIKEEGRGPLGRRLLRKDLKFVSPYNTYLNAGLPPGPIANPGKQSIEAVLNPAKHDYIYFVADGTGGHAFGKTLAEHNDNVRKWRKIRSQK